MIGPRRRKKVRHDEKARPEWRISKTLAKRPGLGRREVDFRPYSRLIIPSFCLDYTEFLLREYGKEGRERFLVWAGTLKDDFAFASTIVVPPDGGGLVDADTVSRINDHLDGRDLIPLAQIHTHPYKAFLSEIDSQMPFFACSGFLSIIIPEFASDRLTNLARWKIYRYLAPRNWRELSRTEIDSTVIVDDSAIVI